MNAVRTVVAGGLAGLLAAGTAIAAMTAIPASAASLRVDGGVVQVFVIDDLPAVPLPGDIPVQIPVAVAPAQPDTAVPIQRRQQEPVTPPVDPGTPAPAEPSAPSEAGESRQTNAPSAPSRPEEQPRYDDCAAARDAGATPLTPEDPGYRAELDPDGDGVACEADDPAE